MRINKHLAQATGMSRRAADTAIADGRVRINGRSPLAGDSVGPSDTVTLDGMPVRINAVPTTIMFHKPAGYIVSREGQGGRTIYDILPPEYQDLKPIGRLDKYSSGLLLLTNDGELAHRLTHPSFQKTKIYEITLDKQLAPLHHQMINDYGIRLEDGLSKLQLERMHEGNDLRWRVRMHEGRNRQIRRTFAALGYEVKVLHRTHFGPYSLNTLLSGKTQLISTGPT